MPEGFYTYIWLRDDGTPYYVGKGHGERAFSPYKRRFSKPQDSSCILIQEFPSEEDALAAEIFLIAYYGRKDKGTGVLRNLTDGGENPPSKLGFKHSEETIKHFSEIRKGEGNPRGMLGKHQTSKQKEAMRRVHTGKVVSEDTKKRMSVAQQGHTVSVEARTKMRAAKLGSHPSEETLVKLRKRVFSEETREKLRIAQRARRQRERFEHGKFFSQ